MNINSFDLDTEHTLAWSCFQQNFNLKKQNKAILCFHVDLPDWTMLLVCLFYPIGAFMCLLRWAEMLNVKIKCVPSSALRPVCSPTVLSIHISLKQNWECEIFTCSTAAAGPEGMNMQREILKALIHTCNTEVSFSILFIKTVSLCSLCLCMYS